MKIRLIIILVSAHLFVTAQSGISWSMPMNIAASSFNNEHPRIVLDGKGNPLVIWGNSSTKKVMFTRWTGTAFTAPIALNPAAIPVFTASWAGPDIVSKGDTVYIVFKQTPEDTNHIYLIRSFNGGMNFNAPVRVDFIGKNVSRFPTLTTDMAGNPLMAFMKFDSVFGNSRWVVSRSNDFGLTFSADVLASGFSGGEVCDCCPAALVSANNKVMMLYRDNLTNLRDIWTGVSSNNAASFSKGMDIDQNKWMLLACPSSGPDGVIVDDTLYSVYMSGASGTSKVYRNKNSVLNVLSSKGNLMTTSNTFMQNFPRIANYNQSVAEVWEQDINGSTQLGLFFTTNIHKGFPSTYDTVAMSSSATIINTDVAVYNNAVWVVWEEGSTGVVRYRKGTYSPASNGIKQVTDLSGALSVYPNPVNSDILNIKCIRELTEKFQVTITDILGQDIISYTNLDIGNNRINIKNLKPGTYTLKLNSEGQIYITKFTKL